MISIFDAYCEAEATYRNHTTPLPRARFESDAAFARYAEVLADYQRLPEAK